jgi:hypothetical protein
LKKYFSILLFCIVHQSLIAQTPLVYSINEKALMENKLTGNKTAFNALIEQANKALEFRPVSVMEKADLPPSGDKHDYMSLAPYFWPNPDTKDGLPYIRKDGQTNPEVRNYKDKDYMPSLCAEVEKLGLAYFFTGDEKYAKHAATLLRVWFIDPATKMNPNLNFGQAVKGQNTGRGAGLIDTRHFIKVIDAVALMQTSTAWSKADNQALQKWFASFLNWMQTSKNGTEEMKAVNNHGVWYDAQRLAFALYTNNTKLSKAIVANVQKRLESQMDSNGFFPAELARTTSLHYSLFVLEPFVKIAEMAKHVGVDLWNYKAPNGNSIKKGCDALLPYLLQQKVWTGEQIKPFNFNEPLDFFASIAKAYQYKDCAQVVNIISDTKYLPLQIIY